MAEDGRGRRDEGRQRTDGGGRVVIMTPRTGLGAKNRVFMQINRIDLSAVMC